MRALTSRATQKVPASTTASNPTTVIANRVCSWRMRSADISTMASPEGRPPRAPAVAAGRWVPLPNPASEKSSITSCGERTGSTKASQRPITRWLESAWGVIMRERSPSGDGAVPARGADPLMAITRPVPSVMVAPTTEGSCDTAWARACKADWLPENRP